jgi:hypothetical protein
MRLLAKQLCEFCGNAFSRRKMKKYNRVPKASECPQCHGSGLNAPVDYYKRLGFHDKMPDPCKWCMTRYVCKECEQLVERQHLYSM